MSTGPVQPKAPSSTAQIVVAVVVAFALVFGVQYLATHLRLSWVSPNVPKPVDPKKPDKPDVKPVFPSSAIYRGVATHA